MTNVLNDLLAYLPTPSELLKEADNLVQFDSSYRELITEENYPLYLFYKSNDGSGQEGNIVFYHDGDSFQALIYAYDNESDLSPDLKKEDSEEYFNQVSAIWDKVPATLRKPVTENSPLLWKFDEYPATYEVAYATVAAWTEDGSWTTDSDDESAQEKVNHLKYSFSDFDFIKKFREETS